MGMELDIWKHTKIEARAGTNAHFGSPRAWIGRAYDMKFQNDYPPMNTETTIDFREVTIGAIFYRPCQLPNFGNQRVVYRFFRVPLGYMGSASFGRGREYQDLVPVIGVALAVPTEHILTWYQTLQQDSQAVWLWASMPIRLPEPSKVSESRTNTLYDYEEIYRLLDSGMRVGEIATRVNGQQAAVSYIKKRWEQGLPPTKKQVFRKFKLDHSAIVADIDSGLSAAEVAIKHETTKTTIYTIVKKYRG